MGVVGFLLDRPLIRPLVRRGQWSQIIATLALQVLIQSLMTLIFGASNRSVSSMLTTSGTRLLPGVFVTWASRLTCLVSVAGFLVVWWLLNRTSFGLQVRAT